MAEHHTQWKDLQIGPGVDQAYAHADSSSMQNKTIVKTALLTFINTSSFPRPWQPPHAVLHLQEKGRHAVRAAAVALRGGDQTDLLECMNDSLLRVSTFGDLVFCM